MYYECGFSYRLAAYSQSEEANLCIQVDAAINPGNLEVHVSQMEKFVELPFKVVMEPMAWVIIPASILTRMVDELKVSMELEKELNCLEMRKFAEFPLAFNFLRILASENIPSYLKILLASISTKFLNLVGCTES